VDSLNFKGYRIIAGSFIENQIKNASVIVISKLERFSGDVTEFVCDLRNVNPDTVIVARPWREEGFLDSVLAAGEQRASVSFGHGHAHMDAVTLRTDRDFSREECDGLIRSVISGECGGVLRAKGFLRIGGALHLLNIAMRDVVLEKAAPYGKPGLTFIGGHLDKACLERLLSARE